MRAAMAQVEEWPDALRNRRAYVLASEEWHEGVIGIVASRLVERYHRPVVLIAAGEQEWKGSGRSIPAFDLHGGLNACSGLLERFGGHRAAAGLSIRPERIDEFARRLRRPCRGRALGRRPAPGDADRRRRPARRSAHPGPLSGAWPGSRRSGSATRT